MSGKKNMYTKLMYDYLPNKQEENNRKTGIDIIGAVPWGTHLCQFYKTKEDLVDILIPYFVTGLQNNEFCMWITSEPLHVNEAKKALKKALKGTDNYIKKGQIEILDATDWYTKSGEFNTDEVLAGWIKKEELARKKGFDGLRLTGNTFWLEKKDWKDFTKYEELINHIIGNYKMIAICSYSLDKCNASEIIDVVSNHQFALIKREGTWHRIESPEMKKSEEERLNLMQMIDQIQDGILIADSDFRITYWNKGAEQMFGYNQTEAIGKTTLELLQPVYAPGERKKIIDILNNCGISKAIVRTKHRNGSEILSESHATRIINETGSNSSYVIVYRDVTDREKAQTALKEAELKYRTVADNTYDFEFWINPEGRYLYASKSCKRITGYDTKDFLSNPSLRQDIIHPDDKQIFLDHISHEVTNNKPGELEFRILHKDGSTKWIHHVCLPIKDENGKSLGTRGSNRDITERKRIEEAFTKQNQEIQTIFDTVPASIFYKDKENRFIRVNRSFTEMMGLPKEELEGKSLFDLYPKEQAEAFWNDDKQVIITGKQKLNIIEPVKTKKGVRWVQTHKIPYRDAQGNIIGIVGFTIDITERTQAEEQLRETSNYLENLLNYANAPIIVWDSAFKITRFNHAFEHLSGYNSKEMIGKNLDILFPIENKEKTLKKIKKTLKGEFWESVEIPILQKNGQICIALWNSANIYDRSEKKLIATIAQGLDITERKQMEKEIQESEEKYRRIVENTTNVIMVTQPNGLISYLSPSCNDILGYLPEDLVGKNPEIFHPDDKKKVNQALSKALKGGKGSNFEYRIITKQRNIKWVSHSWSPIFLKKKIQSVVSVIEDITPRKEIENNIKELNKNLIHQAVELEAANKELEAFSYSVSHDLRAPLRSIDGFSQAILEDYANKLDEQGKDYIQRVRNATQKMGQLIDDMLRLSRLSRAELHYEQVDLSDSAHIILDKLQVTEPSRKVKATIQDKLIVKTDKKLLDILLENLLGNAWKFTGNNKNPTIEFGSIKKEKETIFFVRDNGAGFDMAYADKLFIPFQRLHSVDEFPGTGIGLAIVSRIIHRHGGRIWAEGEIGKGATFYFTLNK